jgi:Cu/Zn superoxide dismutase
VILVGTALLVAGSAVARPAATTITVRTAMTAAQEVPAPTGDVSAARGTFSATVTKTDSGASLAWQLSFSGLTGAARAAHIHTGRTGEPGPVVVPLCGPCESPASGNATVTPMVLEAIQSGGTYVNVHTAANAPGEVRGQLAVVASFRTALTTRQEVPRPKGTRRGAGGTFTGTVSKGETRTTLTWRLQFRNLTGRAAAAHIHAGQRGRSGPVIVPLCQPCRTGMRRTVTLQPNVVAALEAGRAYVNVHTARNQAGEIRGQIRALPLSIG